MMKHKTKLLSALLLSLPLLGCGGSGSSSGGGAVEPELDFGDKDEALGMQAFNDCQISDPNGQGDNVSQYWCAFINTRDAKTGLHDPDTPFLERHTLADFSYAGYRKGEMALPDTTQRDNYVVYDVTDFGAIANDGNSDKAAIRALIAKIKADRVGKEEYKPALIVFPEGEFIVNDQHDMESIHAGMSASELGQLQPIFIELDKVVLSGVKGKTTLFMKEKFLPTNPSQMWSTPYLFQIGAANSSTGIKTTLKQSVAAYSSHTIEVASAARFQAGDSVSLTAVVRDNKVIDDAISPYQMELNSQGKPVWSSLLSGLVRTSRHTITEIDGNQLTFATPVAHNMEVAHNWVVEKEPSFAEIGVENLIFKGNWQEKFIHHGSADHDGAYSLLSLRRAHDSWIRDVTFVDVNRAMNLGSTYNITNHNITIEGTPGHSAISIASSNNVLSKDIVDTSNAWHASGLSKYSTGVVYVNSTYSHSKNIDLHGEQSVYNLFDNVEGGWVYGKWGASTKNQPNHLKGLVYWNATNTSLADDGPNFANYMFMNQDSDFGRLITPYVIGLQGRAITFAPQSQYMHKMNQEGKANYRPDQICDETGDNLVCDGPLQAHVESMGKAVYPASLYQAQLDLRLSR